MHTFSTFHLIATGLLLTGQGIIHIDALAWGNHVGPETSIGLSEYEIASVREERNLAILADLAGAGVVNRPDLATPESGIPSFDCHQNIRQRIELQCAADDTGSKGARWDEGERTGVAIALTLCSIKSALQSPPNECEAWSPFAQTEALPFGRGRQKARFPEDDEEGRVKRGRCLEALHRSPQDWSSYNGYLSDAAKQCHILKGQQTLDLAKDIYINSTLEKVALIQMLKDHELARRHSEDVVERGWLNRVDTLQQIAGEFDRTVQQFDFDLARGDKALRDQLEILSDITSQALSNKEDFWKAAEDSMGTILQETATGLSEVITTRGSQSMEDLAVRLEHIVEAHKLTVSEQEDARSSMISQYMSTLEERTLRAYDSDRARMDEVAMRWSMMQNAMDITGKELEIIVTKLRDLDPAITDALDMAAKFKDISLANLEQSRVASQELQASLSGSLSMAMVSREAWKDLKHDFDDERNNLESRKAGRSKGALTNIFSLLTHHIFPNPLQYPLIQLITTSLGRYPSILPVLQAIKMVTSLAFDGLYWMFWITTWGYVLLQTGMWRIMRIVHKVLRDVYKQLQEGSPRSEEGELTETEVGWVLDRSQKGKLWELPLTPESTPRKPASISRGTYSRKGEEGRSKGFEPTAQTSGALGLIMEEQEDVFGTTRLIDRPERAGGRRSHSLAAQVDRMKRRAQSEPLL